MMGLASQGVIVRSGEPLAVQGVKPSGIAIAGQIAFRGAVTWDWSLLLSTIARGNYVNATPTTPAVNTTGASLFVVIASFPGNQSGTMSDSQSNSWNLAFELTDPAVIGYKLYYCINPSTAPTHVFTHSGATYASFIVAAFQAGEIALDQTSTQATIVNATIIQNSPITPTKNNSLIIAAYAGNDSANAVAGGFSMIQNLPQQGGTSVASALAYQIHPTIATVTPIWTVNATNWAKIGALSFKPV